MNVQQFTSIIHLCAACNCNVGKRREKNEDNFYFDDRILPQENIGLKRAISAQLSVEHSVSFGIFDGMGGEADGQIASFLSASVFKRDCATLNDYVMRPKEFLRDAVTHMNDAVWPIAEENFNHMGSTAVILHFVEDEVYVCNVGDSKAFRLRQKGFQQLSKDHTDAEFLEKMGIKNRRPKLTQCIGVSPDEMELEPYIAKGKVESGDQYLLCSDGLTDMVAPEQIGIIMEESSDARSCAEQLVAVALKNGGRDNTTVIVVRVE